MKKGILYGLFSIVGLGLVVLAFGPRPDYPEIDGSIRPLSVALADLENYVAQKENSVTDLKLDNEARIIWADSLKEKTPFSLVYLHGFSASHEEGDPIHKDFAMRYGCNLYLSRLADHGRADSNSFRELTPSWLLESAREAVAIGKILGDQVIVMSCSTGSTLSAFLAAENPESILSQIMYSPNIDVKDPMSEFLTYPWGYQVAEMSFGGPYNRIDYPPQAARYWNNIYHIQGLVALKALINKTMTRDNFSRIRQPLFLGYYYKNEQEQDNVVSVPKMLEFYDQISTPKDEKRKQAFPEAGRHVIASHLMSGDVAGVRTATFTFAEEVLGLEPKTSLD